MNIVVHLLRETGIPEEILQDTERLFHMHPGPVSVLRSRNRASLPRDDSGTIPWDGAFQELQAIRRRNQFGPEDNLLVLTTAPNELNWYAVFDPDDPRSWFAQVADFSWATTAPNWAIVAHYILKEVVNRHLLEAGVDPVAAAHMEPRGCFSDFCPKKVDLGLKLRTADICGDCLHLFQSIGLTEALVSQIIAVQEAIRLTALSTTPYLPAPVPFENWPFPVAITRHKVTQVGNPLLRLLFLLDHFDSLVRYSYLANELIHNRRPDIVERPSLGWWVAQLANSVHDVPELRAVVRIAEEGRIVALRNERRGHGWLNATAEAYSVECRELEATIGRIEASMATILHQYILVQPMDIQMQDGAFVVDGKRLSGSHILHPNFTHRIEADPRTLGLRTTGQIYLATHSMDQFWDCSPYILSAVCPECRHDRVLIIDGAETYIDTQIGHRVEVSH